MKTSTRFYYLYLLPFLLLLQSCSKDNAQTFDLHTITLYNQPLNVIQGYTNGKWKLLYSKGGIANVTVQSRNNQYINLSADHIQIGNDSLGVIVDTTLTWKQVSYGTGTTYLLTYTWTPGYAFPYQKVIQEKLNDTLIIKDYGSDAVFYYYIRF